MNIKTVASIISIVFLCSLPYLFYEFPYFVFKAAAFVNLDANLQLLGIALFLFGVFWIDKINKIFIKRDYELGGRGYPFIMIGFTIWFFGRNLIMDISMHILWISFICILLVLGWLFFVYTKNLSDFASKDFVPNKRTNLFCLIGSLALLFIMNVYLSSLTF